MFALAADDFPSFDRFLQRTSLALAADFKNMTTKWLGSALASLGNGLAATTWANSFSLRMT